MLRKNFFYAGNVIGHNKKVGTKMKLIKELLEEAEKENRRGSSFLTDSNKQKLREQWILGKFAENYNQKAIRKMEYANRLEAPDFEVFDSERNRMSDVEITEALDKGRRRTLEYRIPTKEVTFIPKTDYFPVIERLILQKCSKKYPKATVLIIYLDVFSSIYDKFTSETFSQIPLPEKCNLSQIWLLDSGGDKILQIF